MNHVKVISFGYGHGAPPLADVVVDIRKRLYDPHTDVALRELTGKDPVIRAKVVGAHGFQHLLDSLVDVAWAMEVHGVPLTIAIGCAGGRHRSVVLADKLSVRLNGSGEYATHRDIGEPVLVRKVSAVDGAK
jgi:RNase adaptor protein for sRNA GlmZ degradation